MNVQAAPSPYTAVGNAPVLGAQIPGTTGGLPAQAGLSALANPMAQQLQSMGRDDDTMLVHMTPDEVNSLQGLAMAAGGSLTINPETGLPEAFSLKKLLPTLLGGALAATGIGAPLAAGIVGLGQTALTGNLQKGLMAGLGAFGGASLAGAAGLGGALGGAKTAAATGTDAVGQVAQATQAAAPAATIPGAIPGMAGTQVPGALLQQAGQEALLQGGTQLTPGAAQALAAAKAPGTGFLSQFGQAARQGLPGGIIGKAAPAVAGMGLLGGISEATQPGFKTAGGQIDNSYQGPYVAQPRTAQFAPSTADVLSSSKERDYFPIDIPEIRDVQGRVVQPGTTTAPGTMIYQNVPDPRAKKNQNMFSLVGTPFGGFGNEEEEQPMGVPYGGINPMLENRFADGGAVNMRDGSFVVDARTVSEIGNGSSNAGIEALSRMGGRPVRGPGDGVSDSVKASIGGKQEARVARDEVIFPPDAVRRVGGGSDARGTKKLYALMDKAYKARKKAGRGQDTKVRRGLA